MENILKGRTRIYILFLLIAFLAYFAGEALFKVMAERTLGSILRHNLKTIAIMALIFAFCNEGFISGIFNFGKVESFSIKQVIFAVLSGIFLGIIAFKYSYFGIIYGGIALFILFSLAISVFFIFSGKSFYALCIFWCVLPFIYFMQTQVRNLGFERVVYEGMAIPFSAFFILILFLALILAVVQNRQLFNNKNLRFAYWLILLSIPSLFFSDKPIKSCVYFSLDMVIPIIYFIIIITAVKTREQIKWSVQFILFSVLVFIFITFYFYGMSVDKVNLFQLYTENKFLISPPALACMAVLMLPFTFLLYKTSNNKLYLFVSLLFILLAVICNKRSTAIGIIVIFMSLFMLSKISRIKKIQGLAVIFVFLCVLIYFFIGTGVHPNIKHRIITTYSELRRGASFAEISSGRAEIWDSAIRMIKDHPIMGIGAGMWQDYAFLYKSKEYTHYYPGYGYFYNYSIDSHNFFFDLYLKYGIFTLLLFLYFLFYTLRKGFLLCKRETAEDIRKLAMGSCVGLLVWMFFAIIGWRFYSFQSGVLIQGFIFWSLTAVIFKSMEISEKEKKEKVLNDA